MRTSISHKLGMIRNFKQKMEEKHMESNVLFNEYKYWAQTSQKYNILISFHLHPLSPCFKSRV